MSTVLAYPGTAGPARGPGHSVSKRLVGFVRLLRDNGFPVGLREGADAARLAGKADLSRSHELRWGLRALLCSCRADWKRFDELFDAYWLRRGMKQVARIGGDTGKGGVRRLPPGGASTGPTGAPDRVERGNDSNPASAGGQREGASTAETLSKTDFRHIADPEALAQIYDLADRLAARMRYRLTRRYRVAARGRRLDLRNTIHKSMHHGGTPFRLAYRRRRERPVRLVVILDASGSMSVYSSFFIRFIRGIVDRFREAEAFVFHTRLVHIGPALKERNIDRALERMSLLASGWSGGTKIGESLAAFNRGYAASVLNSRSVVMIVSDGYDTGPAEELGEALRQLRRRARRIVWLNPMIGWRDYEPAAAGMQAALPHLDLFAPAHNLESLMALEPYLAKL